MTARRCVLVLLIACGGGGGDASPDAAAAVADGGAPAALACDDAEHAGEGTYYGADGSGNCSFEASPNDLMVAAMNAADYADSGACGACARLRGPDGEVTVRVVDQCPECKKGDVDLSPQAFDRIAARSRGRVPIRWQYVPCAVRGPVRYRFKEGSSQWWTAVQVRNHLHPIAKLEVEQRGAFVTVPRLDYNYFVAASGMGPGPYTFRITDAYGGQLVDRGITLKVAAEVTGGGQLPACAP